MGFCSTLQYFVINMGFQLVLPTWFNIAKVHTLLSVLIYCIVWSFPVTDFVFKLWSSGENKMFVTELTLLSPPISRHSVDRLTSTEIFVFWIEGSAFCWGPDTETTLPPLSVLRPEVVTCLYNGGWRLLWELQNSEEGKKLWEQNGYAVIKPKPKKAASFNDHNYCFVVKK